MSQETVFVMCHLPLVKKGRKDLVVSRWACRIEKPAGWSVADFTPFAIEEESEYGKKRYEFKVFSVDIERNQVYLENYEVARSKSWPIERCLMGCGWENRGTAKVGHEDV